MSIPIASLPSYLSTKSPPEVEEIRKQLERAPVVSQTNKKIIVQKEKYLEFF